jgi:hypothetical protein
MSKYLVQEIHTFFPGRDAGGTEKVPEDLRDEDGVLFRPLAHWPREPLEVKARDQDDAIQKALEMRALVERAVFLHPKLGKERYEAMKARERPGVGGSSVKVQWIVKAADDCSRARWLMAIRPGSVMGIARGELGLSLA